MNSEWPPEVVSKVEEDFANRNKVQEDDPQLFEDVNKILFRHDPIGINFETNTDEYEPEAGTIIPRLKDCKDEEDVLNVVYEEFIRWFDQDTAGSKEKYDLIAKDIWEVWLKSKKMMK